MSWGVTAPEASGALRLERVAQKTFTGNLAHLTPHCLSRRIRALNSASSGAHKKRREIRHGPALPPRRARRQGRRKA